MTTVRPIVRIAAVLVIGVICPSLASGEAPADPLLRLVPADAAVTIAVEDLRGHAEAFAGSPLSDGLRKLPAVRDWLASDRSLGVRTALKKAETALGEDLSTLRDELFGEAVVLTLRLPPGARTDEARGLLLVRVPNRELLNRMIGGLNAALLKSGELLRVSDRMRSGIAYHVREFQPGRRDLEYYASLDDRVFAWSNSEELIQGAIDRQSKGTGGLDDLPDFQRVRGRLPSCAAASLYVDPRFIERLMALSALPQKPGDEKVFALLTRYLASVRYAGAALEWHGGLVLHTEEVIDPTGLGRALRRWAARTDLVDAASRRVPPSALLMATAHLDFGTLADVITGLMPERERSKLENLHALFNGLLLGLDVWADVVPQLGPGALAYAERPEGSGSAGRLPVVLSIEIQKGDGGVKASSAIDNALRTVLAIYALDEKHDDGRLRIESRAIEGTTITGLSPSTPFAYAVRDDRLIVGNTIEAVARSLIASTEPRAATRVERVRAVYFPDSVSFVLADLRGLHDFADGRRPELARLLAERQSRSEPDAARELNQALALIDLFDAAFFSTTVSPDATRVRHALGLVRIGSARP